MGREILVDTSAIFSLLCPDDINHKRAKAFIKGMKDERLVPLITNFIVAEAYALLMKRLGGYAARVWLMNNRWPVERIIDSDEMRTKKILFKYADKDFSYTDAVSFAVMERLEIEVAFTFDRHFVQFGFKVLPE